MSARCRRGDTGGMATLPEHAASSATPFEDATSLRGLTSAEAVHRLLVEGANELVSRRSSSLPGDALKQLTHPLALLLWLAAALAWPTSGPVLAIVIVGVITLNALFAVLQERQAERAVEALRAYMPTTSTVIRDGCRQVVDARTLVPGDLLAVSEGDRISADARLVAGGVEVDMSALTGESMPVERSAVSVPPNRRRWRRPTSSSAVPRAQPVRRRRWCWRRGCGPSSAVSRH